MSFLLKNINILSQHELNNNHNVLLSYNLNYLEYILNFEKIQNILIYPKYTQYPESVAIMLINKKINLRITIFITILLSLFLALKKSNLYCINFYKYFRSLQLNFLRA